MFVALALIVTLIARPRARRILPTRVDDDLGIPQNPSQSGAEASTETRAAA